jgi:hypothetical protein
MHGVTWRFVLCAMATSDDDCWRLAGECGRWADEAEDKPTRDAFRQMAKAWAQLAFGRHFKMPSEKVTGDDGSAKRSFPLGAADTPPSCG